MKGRRSIEEIAAHKAGMAQAQAQIDRENRIANLERRRVAPGPGLWRGSGSVELTYLSIPDLLWWYRMGATDNIPDYMGTSPDLVGAYGGGIVGNRVAPSVGSGSPGNSDAGSINFAYDQGDEGSPGYFGNKSGWSLSASEAGQEFSWGSTAGFLKTVMGWFKAFPSSSIGDTPNAPDYGDWTSQAFGQINMGPGDQNYGWGWRINHYSLAMHFVNFEGGTSYSVGTVDELWHHYAASYNTTTNQLKLYVDGVLISTTTETTDLTSTTTLMVGNGRFDFGVTERDGYFHGEVDEIAGFDRVLTDQEVLQIAQSSGLAENYGVMESTQIFSTDVATFELDGVTPLAQYQNLEADGAGGANWADRQPLAPSTGGSSGPLAIWDEASSAWIESDAPTEGQFFVRHDGDTLPSWQGLTTNAPADGEAPIWDTVTGDWVAGPAASGKAFAFLQGGS